MYIKLMFYGHSLSHSTNVHYEWNKFKLKSVLVNLSHCSREESRGTEFSLVREENFLKYTIKKISRKILSVNIKNYMRNLLPLATVDN